jgi:hypothetical protein
MVRPALYYPYIHIRSEHWLKATLLCAPAVKRIVPTTYHPQDLASIARYTQITGAEGELLQAVDTSATIGAQLRLLTILRENEPAIRTRFKPNVDIAPREYLIHDAKFHEPLSEYLLTQGLAWQRGHTASRFGDRNWIALHPVLGSAIMSTLGLSVAHEGRYDIVTPSHEFHETLLATEEGRIFQTLLGFNSDEVRPPSQIRNDLAQLTISLSGVNFEALNPEDIPELQASKHFQTFQNLIRTKAQGIDRCASHYDEELRETAKEVVEAWQDTKSNVSKTLLKVLDEPSLVVAPEVLRQLLKGFDGTELYIAGGLAVFLVAKTGYALIKDRAPRPYQFLTEIHEKQGGFAQLSYPLGLER